MARTRESASCHLESCNITVRFDNPTFPYCRFHGHLKGASSWMDSLMSQDFDNARNTFYVPEKTLASPSASLSSLTSKMSGLPEDDVKKIYTSWREIIGSTDMSVPENSMKYREQLLETIMHSVKNMGDASIAHCHSGIAMSPEGGRLIVKDHEIIHLDNNHGSLAIDPASSAPFVGVVDGSLREAFGSGVSPHADGLYVSSLFEFAAYSSIKYRTIKTDEEVLWDMPNSVSEFGDDISALRELAKRSNARYGLENIMPKPEFKISPPASQKRRNDDEDILDEIFTENN